jgi:hypothetical protein
MRPVSSMSLSRSTTVPRRKPIDAMLTLVPSLYSDVVLTHLGSDDLKRNEKEERETTFVRVITQCAGSGGSGPSAYPSSSASVSVMTTLDLPGAACMALVK